jgi:hypothetical protein
MLIENVVLMYAEKTETGYAAEVELETADGLGFGGSIEFDQDWNYKLGFLNTWVNTDEDRYFVHEVLSSDDFKNDVMSFIPS